MGAKRAKAAKPAPTKPPSRPMKISAPMPVLLIAGILGILCANHVPDTATIPAMLEGTNATGLIFQIFHSGGGTTHDAIVLRSIIEAQQGEVELISVRQSDDGAFDLVNDKTGVLGRDALREDSTVNIFVEALTPHWVVAITTLAPKAQNWLLLNHEMSASFPPMYMLFVDLVLLKTRHADNIYSKFKADMKKKHPGEHFAPGAYVGFSSNAAVDAASKEYKNFAGQDFNRAIHVAGQSGSKRTNRVLETWLAHPEFPPITVVCNCALGGGAAKPGLAKTCCKTKHLDKFDQAALAAAKNIDVRAEFVPTGELSRLQMQAGIHICPSSTEGFGHYINEARGIGRLVVVPDAPPMNELVSRRDGILITPAKVLAMHCTVLYSTVS
jgi:hypothetical protein